MIEVAVIMRTQSVRAPWRSLRFDLDNENETIRNSREEWESLGEFAMAELIRQILVDEQDHRIDLATVLGEDCSGCQRRPQESISAPQ